MHVRRLVPAMGAFAVLSSPLVGADSPTVTFNGFTDTIFAVADNNVKDASNPDDEKLGAGFSTELFLRANVALGSKITGSAVVRAESQSPAQLNESYIVYAISDTIGLKAGKSYGPVGLYAAEAPDFWAIHSSLIGYMDLYGTSPVGVDITVKAGTDVDVLFGIYNGFFGDSGENKSLSLATVPAISNPGPSTKKNSDLAYVVDVCMTNDSWLAGAHLNAEVVVDTGACAKTGEGPGSGAPVIHIGLNASGAVDKYWTIMGELIYQRGTIAGIPGEDKDSTVAAMVSAKYYLEARPFPMALTGTIQYWTANDDSASQKPNALGVQVALLTNPTSSNNFGWNVEVGYASFDHDDGSDTITGYELSTELLLSF